jgi:uncharacterized protein YoxC
MTKIDSLNESVKKLASHIEITKRPTGNFVTADRLDSFKKDVDKRISSLDKPRDDKMLDSFVTKGEMKGIIESMERSNNDAGMYKKLNERINGLSRRLDEVSERTHDYDKTITRADETLKKVAEQTDGIVKKFDKKVEDLKKSDREHEDKKFGRAEKELKVLRDEMNSIRKVLVKMDERFAEAKQQAPKEGKGPKSIVKVVGGRVDDLEKSLAKIKSDVDGLSAQAKQEVVSREDALFKEMSDKVVFLESRLSAIESLLQRPQPIVLE